MQAIHFILQLSRAQRRRASAIRSLINHPMLTADTACKKVNYTKLHNTMSFETALALCRQRVLRLAVKE